MVIGAVAALMWIGAAAADPALNMFSGGEVRSPDGKWAVTSRANSEQVWLRGKGVRRLLMDAERYVAVEWLSSSAAVILVEKTNHTDRIGVFTLGARDRYPSDKIQRQIEEDIRRNSPKIAEIVNRIIVFGAKGVRCCALVEESGLPPGRSEGPFVVRRAAYRIDLAEGLVQRIARCRGASID